MDDGTEDSGPSLIVDLRRELQLAQAEVARQRDRAASAETRIAEVRDAIAAHVLRQSSESSVPALGDLGGNATSLAEAELHHALFEAEGERARALDAGRESEASEAERRVHEIRTKLATGSVNAWNLPNATARADGFEHPFDERRPTPVHETAESEPPELDKPTRRAKPAEPGVQRRLKALRDALR